MKKTELVFAILLLVSLLLLKTYFLIAIIFITSVFILTLLYLVFGFAIFNGVKFRTILKKSSYSGIPAIKIVLGILLGINIAILLIATVFKLQHWQFGNIMLWVAQISLACFLILSILGRLKNKEDIFYKEALLRSGYYLLVISSVHGI